MGTGGSPSVFLPSLAGAANDKQRALGALIQHECCYQQCQSAWGRETIYAVGGVVLPRPNVEASTAIENYSKRESTHRVKPSPRIFMFYPWLSIVNTVVNKKILLEIPASGVVIPIITKI